MKIDIPDEVVNEMLAQSLAEAYVRNISPKRIDCDDYVREIVPNMKLCDALYTVVEYYFPASEHLGLMTEAKEKNT